MGIIYGHRIVKDGLILYLVTNNTKSFKFSNKLYLDSVWENGQVGSIGQFTQWSNGNTRVYATDPWGNTNIVWKSSTQDPYNATYPSCGGIYCSNLSIDNTKLYRMSYWENRVTNNSATYGRYYFGLNGNGTVSGVYSRSNGGNPNTNPYFWSVNHSSLTENLWYLVVGHIWPVNSGTGSKHVDSGVYNVTGTKIYNISDDFVSLSETTSLRPRTLSIYCGNVSDMVHHTIYPRMDCCDGTEPTIQDLLDNTPSKIFDLSGNGNHGVLLNHLNFETTTRSLVFNGVDDYIKVPHSSTLNVTTVPVTLSVWIKTNTVSGSYLEIIGKGIKASSGYGINLNTNKINIGYHGSSNFNSSTSIQTGVWYHIVGIIKDSNTKIYINGVQDSATGTVGLSSVSNDVYIGACESSAGVLGYFFNGNIANVKIYNQALTEVEILKNYNSLKGRFGL